MRTPSGASDGRRFVVLDGLAEGDLVATAGQAGLAHGAPAEPAAAPDGVRTAALETQPRARDAR